MYQNHLQYLTQCITCCFVSGTEGREKRTFSQLILDTASRFLLPPFSFQIRVGGLYLLYSLYKCQIASPPEQVSNMLTWYVDHQIELSPNWIKCSVLQIRLALKDWEDIKKFEKDAVDAQHLDAVYILRQLMLQKAFHFTAMPTMVSAYLVSQSLEWDLFLLNIFQFSSGSWQQD